MTTRQRWTASPSSADTYQLGEGPHWDSLRQRLSWVDISAGTLWVQHDDEVRALTLGAALGMAVPHAEGGWLCGLGRGIALVDEDGSVLEQLDLEPIGVRMNDGKCDAAGRLFVGSKALDNTPGAGNLWRLDVDGAVTCVLSGLTIANGLGWSPDSRTMYVTDSAAGRIDAYDYDLDRGTLTGGRPFVSLAPEEGAPDGLAVDLGGDIWTALWGGRQVRRYSSDGEWTAVVDVDATHVTSCAFSGPDLSELTITTAWDELTPQQRAEEPDAGRIHRAHLDVRGCAGTEASTVRSNWWIGQS